jgi:prevent-host-death family protein
METALVTTLKRKATRLISELGKKRQPLLITKHGRPAAYLVDVETFTTLNRRLAILEGIARGERALRDRRMITHGQAKKRMARWLS